MNKPTRPSTNEARLCGHALKMLRLATRISPARLAASAGIDPPKLGRIERGTATATASELHRLLKALGSNDGEYAQAVAAVRASGMT